MKFVDRIGDKEVFPNGGLRIMLRGHFFDTIAHVCSTADFQTFEKLFESNRFVIM